MSDDNPKFRRSLVCLRSMPILGGLILIRLFGRHRILRPENASAWECLVTAAADTRHQVDLRHALGDLVYLVLLDSGYVPDVSVRRYMASCERYVRRG